MVKDSSGTGYGTPRGSSRSFMVSSPVLATVGKVSTDCQYKGSAVLMIIFLVLWEFRR